MDLAWVLLFTLIFGLKGKIPIELSSFHASLVIFGMQESARITTYYYLIFFLPPF